MWFFQLTRGSIRSAIGSQYRVPQTIPSALQYQQNVHQNHYQSMQQPTMLIDQQQQTYASSMGLNGHGMVNNNEMLHNNNNHYEYEQYGTLRAPQPQRNLNQLANGPSALINDVRFEMDFILIKLRISRSSKFMARIEVLPPNIK